MASNLDFVLYVCDQLSEAGSITHKKMFGEYGIWLNGKYIACICDNQLFVKQTQAGRALLKTPVEAPPYQGAKPAFLIENLEDRAFLAKLIQVTFDELPASKTKRAKQTTSK